MIKKPHASFSPRNSKLTLLLTINTIDMISSIVRSIQRKVIGRISQAGKSASKQSSQTEVFKVFFYWQQSLLSLPVWDVKRGIHFLSLNIFFNKVKQKNIYKFSIKL